MSGGSITLGGRTFALRQMSAVQIQELLHIVETSKSRSDIDNAIEVIKVGMRRDHEDVDVMDLESVVPEIYAAARIMRLGGFIHPRD